MQRKKIPTLCAAFVLSVSLAACTEPQAGRYIALQPPPAAGTRFHVPYDNFLWVVDTTTGHAEAYQIVDSGDGEWITARLLDEQEWLQAYREKQKTLQAPQPEPADAAPVALP